MKETKSRSNILVITFLMVAACIAGSIVGAEYFGSAVAIAKAKDAITETIEATPITTTASSETRQLLLDLQNHDERMMQMSLDTIEVVVVSADIAQGTTSIANSIAAIFLGLAVIAVAFVLITFVTKMAVTKELQ